MTVIGDWPSPIPPTRRQVDEVRAAYRGSGAGHTLAGMQARLRHRYDDEWLLDVIDERDGGTVWFFSESIEAKRGAECATAEERLRRAGRVVTSVWTQVEGGWDADVR